MRQRNMTLAGCLMGLAIGDAMGYSVDKLRWEEIVEAYGPNGLLGFDLTHGSADVTSYTQLTLFTANALLLAMTRNAPDAYSRSLTLAAREWYKASSFVALRKRPGAGWPRLAACGGGCAWIPRCWMLCPGKSWERRKSRCSAP